MTGLLKYLDAQLIYPSAVLLILVVLAITFDFVTGVAKSRLHRTPITSAGYRETFSKIVQYCGAILIVFIIMNLAAVSNDYISPELLGLIGDGLIVAIIHTEVTSILENLISISPKARFTRYLQASLNVMTFQFNNKLKNVQDETKKDNSSDAV